MNKNNIHVLSRGVLIQQDHILLCKTTDLDVNFYFLPGGHIKHNESSQEAVLREFIEETGSKCQIKRFLGCLEYRFEPGHNSICHNHEYNFVFEVESETLKINYEIPQQEKHIELKWISLTKLSELDFRPKPFKDLLPQWLNSNIRTNIFTTVMT
jgi:8-oxo-dGTP diphosphatase